MTDPIMLTAEDAIAAISRCAFVPGGPDAPADSVVHCFSGGIGCDWSVEAAIDAVNNAYVHEGEPQIAFIETIFGRCLVVLEARDDSAAGGRARTFDTVTP